MSRKDKQLRENTLVNKVYQIQKTELEWYREKRFLMERQSQEKHQRVTEFIDTQSPDKLHRLSYPANQVFLFTESIREERQRLGTDISKLGIIDQRLEELANNFDDPEEVKTCLNSLNKYREQLKNSQSLLRNVFSEAEDIKTKAQANQIPQTEIPQTVEQLQSFQKQLNFLPNDLHKIALSGSEEALPLFKKLSNSIEDQQLLQIWQEQLNLDLFSSQNRPNGKSELIHTNQACIDAFNFVADFKGDLKTSLLTPNTEVIENGDDIKSLVIEKDSITNSIDDSNPFSTYFEKDEKEAPIVEKTAQHNSQKFFFGNKSDQGQESAEGKAPQPNKIDNGYQFQTRSPKAKKTNAPLSNAGYVFSMPETVSSKQETLEREQESLKSQLVDSETKENTDGLWPNQPDFRLDDIKDHTEKQDNDAQGLKTAIIDRPAEENPFNPFSASEKTEQPKQNSIVIFRSNTPELWNTESELEDDQFSIPVNDISNNYNWMGIKRLDTNEEVFCQVSTKDLKDDGDGKAVGFNGSNEFFYGARHLGFFSEQCSTEVETRFTYGGWGFGHLASSDNNADPEQMCGWNGKQINRTTIFEITLYEGRPEQAQEDQVIV